MSITIGIYDFFAHTIPGSLYLIIVAYLGVIFGLITFDFQWLSNLSVVQVVILAIFAYITGLILDSIARRWYHLFKPKHLPEQQLNQFRKRHPDIEIKSQADDWPIALAYIRRQSLELGRAIDKYNVTNVMLRNISLGLIVLSVVEAIQFLQSNFFIWHLVLAVVFAVISIIAIKQSVMYACWFYSMIYETIAAHYLEASDFATRKVPKTEIVQVSSVKMDAET